MNKEALTPLVIKAQAKDADALNELMSACYETLYYYAYNEVKDYDLAADITQESCLEIMDTLENLRKPESFLSWAGRIVTHKCSRYYRQTKKEVYLEENEEGETILDRLPDDSRGSLPEQVQEDKEFKRIMWEMLDSLPPEQRQALLLYYMEEFSVGQIAEMQGVPVGTVKSRLNYGRKAVMSKVDAYEKKSGIKLHSLAPLPLLLSFLFRENKAAVASSATSALQKVYAGITAAGAASAGSTATAAAVGTGLAAKIIAGVTAAVVAVTSSVILLPKLLTEKAPAQQEACLCAEYEGEWTCIIRDENDVITEETLVIYKEGVMEFRGERYNLRMDSFEHYFFASPEDSPIPESEWYTETDRFSLRFLKHREDYMAEIQTLTPSGDGQILWEPLGECIRLSGFEGYTPVRLTEGNITEYLQVNDVFPDVKESPEDGSWSIYSRGFVSGIEEGAFYIGRFSPIVECKLEEGLIEYEYAVSVIFETAQPRTESLQMTLEPVTELLHDRTEVLFEYPAALEPNKHPNGWKGMLVTDARLVGATDVYGFVFVPNE